MFEAAVLFLCYKDDEVTREHLARFRRFHPDIPVIAISGLDSIGYCLPREPVGLWSMVTDNGQNKVAAWGNADLMVYDWYLSQIEIKAKRWLIVEWDTYCNASLKDYWASIWNVDLGCQEIRSPGDSWCWFHDGSEVPGEMEPCGVLYPACLLISDKCLKAVAEYVKQHYFKGFSELRLGTVAKHLGFSPTPNLCQLGEVDCDAVAWDRDTNSPGIWHPIKELSKPIQFDPPIDPYENHEYAILFLCHKNDQVTNGHLERIRSLHPGIPIVPISGKDRLPGGYTMYDVKPGEWHRISAKGKRSNDALLAASLMIDAWYLQKRKFNSKRWLVVEWDVLCNMNLKGFWKEFWDADFATTRFISKDEEWNWFKNMGAYIPNDMKEDMCGVSVSCTLFSDKCLKAVAERVTKKYVPGNNELRIGTTINHLGFEIDLMSEYPGKITYEPLIGEEYGYGVWHPVKDVA